MDRDQVCNAPNTFTHEVELYLSNTADVYQYWWSMAKKSIASGCTNGTPSWFLFDSELRRLLDSWDDQAHSLLCGKQRKHDDKNVFQSSLFASATSQVDTRWIAECWIERVSLEDEDYS